MEKFPLYVVIVDHIDDGHSVLGIYTTLAKAKASVERDMEACSEWPATEQLDWADTVSLQGQLGSYWTIVTVYKLDTPE